MATRPMSDKIEDSNEFIQELLDEVCFLHGNICQGENSKHFEKNFNSFE
jgi:hypothetical protein